MTILDKLADVAGAIDDLDRGSVNPWDADIARTLLGHLRSHVERSLAPKRGGMGLAHGQAVRPRSQTHQEA